MLRATVAREIVKKSVNRKMNMLPPDACEQAFELILLDDGQGCEGILDMVLTLVGIAQVWL